jgi:hypothetical protein
MGELKTEHYTGTNCSGSDGGTNRVLTLSNNYTTADDGFLVHVSGLALAETSEYTVSHKSASTTITFLKALFNDQTIVVQYEQEAEGLISPGGNFYQTSRTDFQNIVIENGISATLVRQTETTASMGDVSAVSEETWTIYTVIQDITKKDRQIHEMGLAVPGNSKAFFFHEYPDSITGNGTVTPEEGDIVQESDGTRWRIEQILGEKRANANEIFRAAVIKKIDLTQ